MATEAIQAPQTSARLTFSDRAIAWVVFALTGVGVFSVLFDVIGLFVFADLQFHMPCANAGLIFIPFMLLVGYLGFLCAIAGTGGYFFWERSPWGAAVLMLANLLVMGWFGWFRPVEAGQLVFGLAVVTLGLAPAAAVVLLIWPLIRWGRGLMKIARILVLLGLAILMVRPYSTAFSNELGAALQSPPPVTADSGGGHC